MLNCRQQFLAEMKWLKEGIDCPFWFFNYGYFEHGQISSVYLKCGKMQDLFYLYMVYMFMKFIFTTCERLKCIEYQFCYLL